MSCSIEDFRFKGAGNYSEPTAEELDDLCQQNDPTHQSLDQQGKRKILTFADSLDTTSPYDNRTIVRILLWRRFKGGYLSNELYQRLLEPYGNEFYKKANGKSAPTFLKVIGLQRILGLRKDVVAVRHDFDYYLNKPSRALADWYYLKSQFGIGQWKLIALIEYLVLLVFGGVAYRGHSKSREWIKGYGTIEFIPQLNDLPG